MSRVAVIGLGFGDEGKGRVIDALCPIHAPQKNGLVVRFSGGHQAAHHVVRNGVSHVFANFGSGTLYGLPTYWSEFCTIDPMGVMVELQLLKEKGVEPLLFVNENCPVVTPFDKSYNQALDRQNNHGTCGVGFGATWEREENHVHLKARDLSHPHVLWLKVQQIEQYYASKGFHFTFPRNGFQSYCQQLMECKQINQVQALPSGYDNLLFEGSQGLLLDQDIGFFPHVTRSNTGGKNIQKMVGWVNTIYLVTRSYQTRHGNGPMTNENIPHNIKENPYEQNADNGCQGKFRKGLLDLNLLRYALDSDCVIRNHLPKTLVITCMDCVENAWQLTADGSIHEFDSENGFIKFIQAFLKCPVAYLSRRPEGPLEYYLG